jgi:hypothetical protein
LHAPEFLGYELRVIPDFITKPTHPGKVERCLTRSAPERENVSRRVRPLCDFPA